MGLLIFIVLSVIGLFVAIALIGDKHSKTSHYAGYAPHYYDDDEDDFDDFETSTAMNNTSHNTSHSDNYKTRAYMTDREYQTDDLSNDYDSYYEQVADEAMMGDEDAMEELRDEFGDEDW